eukprot:56523_1
MLAFLLVFYSVGVLAVLGLIKPCLRYAAGKHVRHPKFECTSPCWNTLIPGICYYGTLQDPATNEYYRVVRYRRKEQHLDTHSREYDCRRDKHTHSARDKRYQCGSAHVAKIEGNRDNYCSDHHYKCIKDEKKGKYKWECYFKYGEWVDTKAPFVEKEGHKVKVNHIGVQIQTFVPSKNHYDIRLIQHLSVNLIKSNISQETM